MPLDPSSEDRLDSWKEIAAYLKRDVTTVQRWERREGMPVHRHVHDKSGSVYAFRTELDAWSGSRKAAVAVVAEELGRSPEATHAPRRLILWLLAAAAGILVLGLTLWQLPRADGSDANPLTGARFQQFTDFGGTEQAAALSRDGKFVTFLSDRDGRMDVWVSQVGMGQFYNLTRGVAPELVNPSVRTLGFSPDGTVVTFWARKSGGVGQADIGIWASPVLGGAPRPYLEGVAEFDWSSDGTRLVYHTPGPGDPMFVRDRDGQPRQIFSAPPGLHAHFPIWSPDQSFIYFVQGTVPDRMDIWRLRPSGEAPERITTHDARVSHPVFVDAQTLLYLATDSDGSGASIYSLDVDRRKPQRLTVGIERYSSLASSSDGRRLVATMSSPKGTLWRLPVAEAGIDSSAPRRVSLTTGNGFAPRLGPDFLLYVTSKGDSDGIWKLQGDVATELWSAAETRISGAPAISRDGRRMVFVAKRNRQTSLYLANADGTNARVLTSSLQLQGSPAWAPDEQSIAVGAVVDGSPRILRVPIDGSTPTPLVHEHAVDPAWSPDGDRLVYSGPDIGTTFPVKMVTGAAYSDARPILTLTRGSRHLSFMPGGRSLVVLRGELGHKNLWLVDLATGDERQITNFAPGFNVRDFDISPDGREIVVEQVQEHSDIVLIDLPRR